MKTASAITQRASLSLGMLVAVSLSGCSSEPLDPIVKQGSAVDHGAALFNDPAIAGNTLNQYACATCHETGATDTKVVRPGGSLQGVTKRPSYWGGKELDLLRAINACAYYFMLKADPFVADDEEAKAIYAYLESISQGPEGTAAVPFTVAVTITDLPAGDAARGQTAYTRACSLCHGTVHSGAGRLVSRAPILPDQTLAEHPLGQYTADEQRLVFVEKTRHGGFVTYSGEMPPLSLEKLSDDDMADILQFLDLY